ncbi:MAG: hypothetical protein ACSHXF_16425 [Aquaticitalea sp.]
MSPPPSNNGIRCEMPAQNVYVTKTGEKYHKSTCRYLKNSKTEITLAVAIERSLTACTVCKPKADIKTLKPADYAQQIKIEPESSVAKATATQCTGKTKAGTHCKRMTKSTNGRCHQHE